jgi:hypothetical protein
MAELLLPSVRQYARAADAHGGLDACPGALLWLAGIARVVSGAHVDRGRDRRAEWPGRSRRSGVLAVAAQTLSRGAVLGIPVLCLLVVLSYGLSTWSWAPPALDQIVGIGLTAALASGALTWGLQWLFVAWSAWRQTSA